VKCSNAKRTTFLFILFSRRVGVRQSSKTLFRCVQSSDTDTYKRQVIVGRAATPTEQVYTILATTVLDALVLALYTRRISHVVWHGLRLPPLHDTTREIPIAIRRRRHLVNAFDHIVALGAGLEVGK
jgi:hypothetical protein